MLEVQDLESPQLEPLVRARPLRACGVAVSFATLWIDDAFDHGLIPQAFTGGPDAALAILSAIARRW